MTHIIWVIQSYLKEKQNKNVNIPIITKYCKKIPKNLQEKSKKKTVSKNPRNSKNKSKNSTNFLQTKIWHIFHEKKSVPKCCVYYIRLLIKIINK